MKYQIKDGTVTLGGREILSHIDFEIRENEKIAVVGRNGAGKTTLLRLIAGQLELDRDDKRMGPGILSSRKLTVGFLSQQEFTKEQKTAEQWIMDSCPYEGVYDRQRYEYEYEQEYNRMLTGLGLQLKDKKRSISSFSGGERTKLALIRLLLTRPDILLLDEPTNHLDLKTVQWLEDYLRCYEGAVVMVSHDRFFLDRTVQAVYELAEGRLRRYAGNYTEYRRQKQKNYEIQMKAYLRQQEEIKRQQQLIERFKHKPSKASFARSRKKLLERMEQAEKPGEDMAHIFTGTIVPLICGSKWVAEAEHLKIGYERPLLEVSLRIRRGQKIGILGENGSGKSTFLKTIAGFLEPLGGICRLGNQITIGYFDQFSAAIESDKTVAEHFSSLFPAMTEKEVRSTLGAYLFKGREASKQVSSLSGGQKARLVLAELLCARPNFLILDEPTNHMDIQAKETLESAFQAYEGTILFVSHDRYFIRQVAQSILIFEEDGVMYYPFGYEHYVERKEKEKQGGSIGARVRAEEQALIAGLKAVPKAERHRLKEIPEEEAYEQWRRRLVREPMEEAALKVEALEKAVKQQEEEQAQWYLEHGIYETFRQMDMTLLEEYEKAWEYWHDCCIKWYEVWENL